MTYFNGTHHGYNHPSKGFIPPVPTTLIYCDDCAPEAIPLDKTKPEGRQHWDTAFRWGPNGFLGSGINCSKCGKDC